MNECAGVLFVLELCACMELGVNTIENYVPNNTLQF